MKRIFTILFWLLVAVNVVGQQYAVVDGIRYGYAADTAFVAEANGETVYEGDIVIPSQVTIEDNIYTVTAITDAFGFCIGITTITIPESVTSISEQIFSTSCDFITCYPIYPPVIFDCSPYGALEAECYYCPTIYVPCYNNVNNYTSDLQWSKLVDKIICGSSYVPLVYVPG